MESEWRWAEVGNLTLIGEGAEEEYRQTYILNAILEDTFEVQRIDIGAEVYTVPWDACETTWLHRLRAQQPAGELAEYSSEELFASSPELGGDGDQVTEDFGGGEARKDGSDGG